MITQEQAKSWLLDLKRIQAKALISPRLGVAVEEIQKAIKAKNWDLAYQLTAVKAFICGSLNADKKNAFREDHDANEKTLKASVYVILDVMHHDIAFSRNELPSGMMVIGRNSTTGKLGVSQMKSQGTHPIVRRMQFEHRRTVKEVEAFWSKSKSIKKIRRALKSVKGV